MTDQGGQQFAGILLSTRSGTSPGLLKITKEGIFWRKAGGGKTVEIQRKDVDGFVWSLTSKGSQLGVKRKDAHMVLFLGFRGTDADLVQEELSAYGLPWQTQDMAASGRNWGSAEVDASTLIFRVGNKPAFRVPLRDVGQLQQGKEEVVLEFPVDDTTGGEREDALVGMSFHVPRDAAGLVAMDGEETSSTTVFYNQLVQFTNTEAAVGDPVATFENVGVLAPRGRFEIELYHSFLKLVGQAQDYRIQYDSIVRVFVLPKPHTPHTLVVISLDPPIRKGQTYYPHILVQMPTDEDCSVSLEMTDEQLAEKNEKCGNKLSKSMEGTEPEVFARVIRGLAATKLTKPGGFRTADGASAVRCSYKADDGYLYPLERAFFYVQKPPTLIVFDEIESVEFMRQGGGLVAASVKTFDLSVRQKNDTEFLFRGIQKQEWNNLFSFIQAKRIRIENLEEAQQGPGGGGRLDLSALDLGEDIDTGILLQVIGIPFHKDVLRLNSTRYTVLVLPLRRCSSQLRYIIKANASTRTLSRQAPPNARMVLKGKKKEGLAQMQAKGEVEEEEDEDFEEEPEDDVDEADEEEAEEEEEEKPKKKRAAPKAKADKPAKKPKAAAKEKAPAKEKKPKAKKDKNAPKRGLSAFMFFSQDKRDEVKKEQPDIKFGEVGKVLGEKWRAIGADEKKKYEDMATKDKARYEKEAAAYKEKTAAAGGDEEEEDDE